MEYADVPLDNLQTRLWWITRDRRSGLATQQRTREVARQLCPSCGTSRIAFFRWCTCCGRDFEASHELRDQLGVTPRSGPGADPDPGLELARARGTPVAREPAGLRRAPPSVMDREYPQLSDGARKLGEGAALGLLGLLVGVVVGVVLAIMGLMK